jgi:hypothetical protein
MRGQLPATAASSRFLWKTRKQMACALQAFIAH